MLLRPQDIDRRGLKPVYSKLDDTLVQIPNNGMVVLHVVYLPEEKSEDEGGVVVTVFPDQAYMGDQYRMAQDVVSPGIEGTFIGPFPNDGYTNDETDCMTVVFSSVEHVRVSALRVSRT